MSKRDTPKSHEKGQKPSRKTARKPLSKSAVVPKVNSNKRNSGKIATLPTKGVKRARKGSSKSQGMGVDDSILLRKIREDVWPTERSVLFRPERFRYVRKLIKPSGCVFCQALEAGPSPESLLLHAGSKAMVVINKYPYNAGHLLILPTRHCGDLLELDEAEHAEIQALLRHAVRALKEAYSPSGFNIGLNLGTASGAGIPEHLHYHIVPRWAGDANFFAVVAETKVVVETLEETHRRLLPYFEANL